MHTGTLENKNPESLEPALFEVISDVLEQFAFMFTEEAENDVMDIFGKHLLQAQIVFNGPIRGALSLFATLPFCIQLAANVLGTEPEELSHDHPYDALKELVNVACGDFLLQVAGKKQVFDLTVPKIRKITIEKARETVTLPGVIAVLVDNQPILAQVEIDLAS